MYYELFEGDSYELTMKSKSIIVFHYYANYAKKNLRSSPIDDILLYLLFPLTIHICSIQK